MLKGEFNFELALYPYSGDYQTAEIHKEAISYNFPMLYNTSEPNNGFLGPEMKIFDISSDPIILSALYVDNGKVIMRLHNSQHNEVNSYLGNIHNERRFIETDLKGNKTDTITGNISFKPWQFKTFEIVQ